MGTDTHTNHTTTLTRQLALYGLTLVLEAPVVLLRIFVVWAAAAVTLFATRHSTTTASQWALLGLWPTIWSISALAPTWTNRPESRITLGCVLGLIVLTIAAGHLLLAATIATLSLAVLVSPWATGWWWRNRVGGRKPSMREREAYDNAIAILQQHVETPLPLPHEWFVLDLVEIDAAVCGQTLMLSRALLERPELPAAVAHELGHLASWDARITAAINRLAIHPLREPHPDQERYRAQTQIMLADDPIGQTVIVAGFVVIALRAMLQACRGGLGLWLLRPIWGAEWRTNEYTADQYAANLGQATELAECLQDNALLYDQPVPFSWLTPHTHPPTELRIDRLLTGDLRQAPTADRDDSHRAQDETNHPAAA
jgi:Zn-dependent protease with chaperone function